MILFVPRERDPEQRTTIPDTVKQWVGDGLDVHVQTGAGAGIGVADDDYVDVGATISTDRDDLLGRADIVCTVAGLDRADAGRLKDGALLIGLLAADRNLEVVRTLVERRATAIALELVPRITRAQSMDVLSSQASIAGYRAAVMAAMLLDKQFPLAMTAAGTIRPAKVVVIGAGVAGLQAVATARRLGAVVEVSDVRDAVRGEVESLGATFIEPPEAQTTDDGYAQEVGKDFLTLQREQLTRHIADAHAVITTAAIPGRCAPEIVTAAMVEAMRPGSLIIDLAAASGGNCTLTPATGEVTHAGVRIVAAGDLAAGMPTEASGLLSRNVLELTRLFVADGRVDLDLEDEILDRAVLCRDGEVRHAPTAALLKDQQEEGGDAATERVIVLDEPAATGSRA